MVQAKDVGRKPGFVGLCYSINTPVQLDAFLEQYAQNDTVLDDAAAERLQNTAGAISARLADEDRAPPVWTQVEVVQQPHSRHEQPDFEMHVEVVPEGVEPLRGGRG